MTINFERGKGDLRIEFKISIKPEVWDYRSNENE
jgi:hypothetical protein